MELSLQVFLIVCPLVFLAGLIDSIAGGGGLISLPAYLIAGVPPHFALATNKMSSCIGTSISTARYIKNKSADIKLAIPCIILAFIGSPIGASLALMVEEKIIKGLLLFIIPIVAFYIFRSKNFSNDSTLNTLPRKKLYLYAGLASFFISMYDGFYGPGTGTFLILAFTGLCKMDIRTASGNTKLINLSSNIAALVIFIINGKVLFLLGATATIFSIAGHYIGAGLVLKNGFKIIRPIILVVLTILFITLLVK
ncbi:MAG: hypothetical protein K0S61_4119 [Anaerocolumna sp.]|jgi:uncharacterized membrane protein YfcA|nr:hypothetical protein [Anaerocolumna sp.]